MPAPPTCLAILVLTHSAEGLPERMPAPQCAGAAVAVFPLRDPAA